MKANASIFHHKEVARVGIAVEQPDDEELLQVEIDQYAGQARAIRRNSGIVDGATVAHRLDHHAFAAQILHDGRDVDIRPILEGFGEAATLRASWRRSVSRSRLAHISSTRRTG